MALRVRSQKKKKKNFFSLKTRKEMLVPEDSLSALLPRPLVSEFCTVTGTSQAWRRQCSFYIPLVVIYPKFLT